MALLKSPASYMGGNPQENQYLQGNPTTEPNAQDGWMSQDNTGSDTGWATPSQGQQTQQPPISTGLMGNGTALSAITSGNTGVGSPGGVVNPGGNTGISGGMQGWNRDADNEFYGQIFGNGNGNGGLTPRPTPPPNPSNNGFGQYTPEGYVIDKPDANSTKYQVGRILSNYPPGPEGLQQAAPELARLGIRVVGRDTIMLPDGTTSDVGRAFSDPNPASRAWQYNWSGPAGGSAQGNPVNSYMGNSQNQQQQQSLMNQIMFQMQQRSRGRGFGGAGTMFMGGGIIDPITGIRRNPRAGEPQ